jgi:hypothetical protein
MTSLKANEILKNKFWIIEDKDTKEKVGTLSKAKKYMTCQHQLILTMLCLI